MRIGVPREIKTNENRVALRPAGAEILVKDGHEVRVERTAGEGSGYADRAYEEAGARIVDGPDEVFAESDMILKVKEPLPAEVARIREDQIVFTYFHFAAGRELTEGMIASKAIAIAYETVEEADGTLPLLVPMSEVAGRMAVQEGANAPHPWNGRPAPRFEPKADDTDPVGGESIRGGDAGGWAGHQR